MCVCEKECVPECFWYHLIVVGPQTLQKPYQLTITFLYAWMSKYKPNWLPHIRQHTLCSICSYINFPRTYVHMCPSDICCCAAQIVVYAYLLLQINYTEIEAQLLSTSFQMDFLYEKLVISLALKNTVAPNSILTIVHTFILAIG